MPNEPDKKTAIDFIDPLFAVVLNVSFAQIYLEKWFRDFRNIFEEPYLFLCGTLALGYLTVILSWIGYHRSIRTKWIDVETRPGRRRFFYDILLLIAYFVLLVSYDNFRRELVVLAVINLLFVIWDYYKQEEWPEGEEPDPEKRVKSAARRGISVFWFLVFSVMAAIYFFWPPISQLRRSQRMSLRSRVLPNKQYCDHCRSRRLEPSSASPI